MLSVDGVSNCCDTGNPIHEFRTQQMEADSTDSELHVLKSVSICKYRNVVIVIHIFVNNCKV